MSVNQDNILTGSPYRPHKIPQYPVLYQNPSFGEILSHFKMTDYAIAFGIPFVLTGAFYISTYRHSKSTGVWSAFTYPAIFGLTVDRVSRRLKGHLNNEDDCKQLGVPFHFKPNPYSF